MFPGKPEQLLDCVDVKLRKITCNESISEPDITYKDKRVKHWCTLSLDLEIKLSNMVKTCQFMVQRFNVWC